MLRLGLVAVLTAAVGVAVPSAPSNEIVVTRDSMSLPAGRSPRQVATMLVRFTAAFNRGDRTALVRWSMDAGGEDEPRIACPRPAGWTPAGPVVACTRSGATPNAQEVVADFRISATRVRFPQACRPTIVRGRLESMLRSFNLGSGDRFAGAFTPGGQLHAYTASNPGSGLSGRAKIEEFVRSRFTAGDGWTGLSLQPPSGTAGLPARTPYHLVLRVTHQGSSFAQGGVKLVVDCRSGLLHAWIGPGIRQPG
jgi:hypothetical protein